MEKLFILVTNRLGRALSLYWMLRVNLFATQWRRPLWAHANQLAPWYRPTCTWYSAAQLFHLQILQPHCCHNTALDWNAPAAWAELQDYTNHACHV